MFKSTWDLLLDDFAQLQSGLLPVTSFTGKVWPAQNNEVFLSHKEQFYIKWRFAVTWIEFVTSIVSQFKETECFTHKRETQPNYYTVKMTQTLPLTQHKCRHFAIFCHLGRFFSGPVMKGCGINSWGAHTGGHINSPRERKLLRVPQEGGGEVCRRRGLLSAAHPSPRSHGSRRVLLSAGCWDTSLKIICLSTPAAHTQSCVVCQRAVTSVNADT